MLLRSEHRCRFEAQVSSSVAAFGRAHATDHGGHGSDEFGLRRGFSGEPGLRTVAQGDPQRDVELGLEASRWWGVCGVREPAASPSPSPIRTGADLEALIDEQTRGDPESALRWICKSTRSIAGELVEQDHPVSHMKVAQILHGLNYSLQSNRKTEEGEDHPDRDAQFQYINAAVKKCLAQGIPVISVDTKKKELLGEVLQCRSAMASGQAAHPGSRARFPQSGRSSGLSVWHL